MGERNIPGDLRRTVFQAAGGRCEYCRIHESLSSLTHHMDHIVALKHGGQTTLENLALSCAICNQHKGSDIASVDPATGDVVPLFHPRRDSWEEHFELTQDGVVVSRTAVARGTARLLRINHPDRVTERKLLLAVGDF